MLRILLADDHAMVRKGFRLILEAQPDMQIVGEAGNGREAVELAEKLHPDVVVMDVAMPELNGIEATRRLVASAPRTRVLALSMHKDSVYVREILRAGARGYLIARADIAVGEDPVAILCRVGSARERPRVRSTSGPIFPAATREWRAVPAGGRMDFFGTAIRGYIRARTRRRHLYLETRGGVRGLLVFSFRH